MDTTIMGLYRGITILQGIGVILGLYWDNGKENGSYYIGFILGLYIEKAAKSIEQLPRR